MPNVYKVEGKAIKNMLGILSKAFHKWISFQRHFAEANLLFRGERWGPSVGADQSDVFRGAFSR